MIEKGGTKAGRTMRLGAAVLMAALRRLVGEAQERKSLETMENDLLRSCSGV